MATVRPSTTPNPNAMKFTLDVTLEERIDTTRGEGADSEFAREVLAADGVASVFGVNDFVTVTREPDADWDAIVCVVEDAAAAHLGAGAGGPATDEVTQARKLLRNAVAPPKPRPVEIGRRPEAASPDEPD
ncbi:MAG TPA: NifU N-terminal domain-containing protein [Acidimicrobiia bacterium]